MFSILDSFSRTLASRGMVEGQKEMQRSTNLFSIMDSFSWSLASRGMLEGQKMMQRSTDVLNHGLLLPGVLLAEV